MSANPPTPQPEPEPLRRRPRRETWTVTFAFTAFDDVHAHTVAQHAARKLALVLPRFDKNAVAVARENDPYRVQPVYCDDDIYCALAPDHDGPCRDQSGADLDHLDCTRDGAPVFGAEI